jgi:hypothetical protein
MILGIAQESRKDWLKRIFECPAKFNMQLGDMQFWTYNYHAIELYRLEITESRMSYTS